MSRYKFVLFLFAFFALLVSSAAAQRSLTCSSNNGKRNYCGSYRQDQIEFQRQISGSPCIPGKTWGVDRQGLWVDRGCRAVFAVRERGRGRGERYPESGRPGAPVWVHPGPGNRWPPSGNWNGGRWERGGACFYTEPNFGGDYFCMRRGESHPSLSGYGDRISSIRLFGGARVTVFNDRNYSSSHDQTRRDIPDLRRWRVSSDPGHTWNDRISSVQVR